jgi:hypothetical protein
MAALTRGEWVPPHIDPRATAALARIEDKRPSLWGGATLADLMSATPALTRRADVRHRAR